MFGGVRSNRPAFRPPFASASPRGGIGPGVRPGLEERYRPETFGRTASPSLGALGTGPASRLRPIPEQFVGGIVHGTEVRPGGGGPWRTARPAALWTRSGDVYGVAFGPLPAEKASFRSLRASADALADSSSRRSASRS